MSCPNFIAVRSPGAAAENGICQDSLNCLCCVVVRIFFKTLLVLGLGLLLLLVLGVLTLPLWGPPLFTFGAGKVLQQAGCSEVVLRLESIGLRQLQLELEHLRFQDTRGCQVEAGLYASGAMGGGVGAVDTESAQAGAGSGR